MSEHRVYPVPAANLEHEYQVKNSRFIARVSRADQRDEALAAVELARAAYPDARHYCWAYLLGDPQNPAAVASSDDGEPAGTAGKPILNVLNHRGIGNIMVVVVRYFGGIKLGAGGLVRAYSTATQQAVEGLSLRELQPTSRRTLRAPYADEAELRRHFTRLGIAVLELGFDPAGVCFELDVPDSALPALRELCAVKTGLELR